MELLIFSDSHGRVDAMNLALSRQIRPIYAICFLGDGLADTELLRTNNSLLWTVKGNCDFGVRAADELTERVIDLMGHRILMTHGHLCSVKSGIGALLSRAVELDADAVMFGHTHEAFSLTLPVGETVGGHELTRPLHLFNPGSIGYKGSFGSLCLTEDTLLFSHGYV